MTDVSGSGSTLADDSSCNPYEVGKLSARFDQLWVKVHSRTCGVLFRAAVQASFHTLLKRSNCQQLKTRSDQMGVPVSRYRKTGASTIISLYTYIYTSS